MAGHLPRLLALALALLLPLVAGCGEPDPTGPPPKSNDPALTATRIVSLSPALTQMVSDMGHLKAIVGVDDSHEMVFEKKLDVPTVGTYSNVQSEALMRLRPTHVITVAGQEGPPAALVGLAESINFKLVTFPYPTSVKDVRTILIGDMAAVGPDGPPRLSSDSSLAHLLGDEHAGFLVANEMSKRLGRISALADEIARPGQKPRVLVVFAVEPRIQAAGPNTVFDDLLTQFAGAYNAAIPDIKPLSAADLEKILDPEKRREAILAAAEDPSKHVGPAPTFDREKLLEARPDVVLLILPGEPPLKSIEEDARLADFRGLDIPAVKNGRIVLISDKTAQLPSTGLPAVAAQMAKAIHPSLAARIDAVLAPQTPKDEKTVDEKVEEKKDAEEKDANAKPAPPAEPTEPSPK